MSVTHVVCRECKLALRRGAQLHIVLAVGQQIKVRRIDININAAAATGHALCIRPNVSSVSRQLSSDAVSEPIGTYWWAWLTTFSTSRLGRPGFLLLIIWCDSTEAVSTVTVEIL
jgi:hypothetical protein